MGSNNIRILEGKVCVLQEPMPSQCFFPPKTGHLP